MFRDQFLEKTYFNKAKDIFTEEIDIRVYKIDKTSSKHHLSISLKKDDGSYIYENSSEAELESGFNNLIDTLKALIIVVIDENSIVKDSQFKKKAFHMTGKEPLFGINELFNFVNGMQV